MEDVIIKESDIEWTMKYNDGRIEERVELEQALAVLLAKEQIF